MTCFVILLLFSSNVLVNVHSEVFSSPYKLKLLLTTQKSVIDVLNSAIRDNYTDHFLKNQLRRFEKEHKAAVLDIDKYLGNPVNTFRLIKRLTVDLQLIENTLSEAHFKRNKSLIYPSESDLIGAAERMFHLESMYGLDITQLANGIWNTSFSNNRATLLETFNPMTISDCYELGRALYVLKYYTGGTKWLEEAKKKYIDGGHQYPEDRKITHEYIENEILKGRQAEIDMIERFTVWFTEISLKKPDIETMNVDLIINSFKDGMEPFEALKYIQEHSRCHATIYPKSVTYRKSDTNDTYTALCKGEMKMSMKDLNCYIKHGPHAFLTLAPMKSELLHISPTIILFHDVISDAEIKAIKENALPELERAEVYYPFKTKIVKMKERICQVATLQGNVSAIAARIRNRVEHLAGMDLRFSEKMLVANYGTGGHFAPHYDYWGNEVYEDESNFLHKGNRIASVLVYMSDVEQGGATAFPRLGIRVFPVKGSALLWINLLPSGHGDTRTNHASCPVLRGSKWVLIQWISLRGQEMSIPCPLNGNINIE